MSTGVSEIREKKGTWNEISSRLAVEAAYNGIVAIDTEGIITVLNGAARRILGIDDDEPGLHRHAEEIAADLWPHMRETLDARLPQIGKKVKIGSLSLVANLTPVLEQGRIVGVVSVLQDAQLSSVKQLVSQLDDLIEISDDGLFVTDGHGNTLRVNLSFEKITGIRPSELTGLVGRNLADLISEGYISNSVTLLVLRTGKAVTINARTKHGKELLLTGNPLLDRTGKISMVVTNVRDITDLNRLSRQLRRSKQMTEEFQIKLQKIESRQQDGFELIARSKAMVDVVDLALRLAAVDTPVLMQGETGVGKEVIARLIHRTSTRAEKGVFMKINCGAIPEHLLESELFGYERGAFTGASQAGKKGLFELADDGTLFLDEIEALSLNLQSKLLSAVQDLEIMRVGGTKFKRISTRIIAASNCDLYQMVRNKTFREDLFFRLNVVTIYVPPLKERKDDILPLVIYFLEKYNSKFGTAKRLSRPAIDCMTQYPWPGNVRQLSNVIERLVITSKADDVLLDDLPGEVQTFRTTVGDVDISGNTSLKHAVDQFEYRFIREAVQKYGSAKKAAAFLKVDPATICRKMQRHHLIA